MFNNSQRDKDPHWCVRKSFALELDHFGFGYLLELGNILNLSEPVSYLQIGITLSITEGCG